MYFDHSRPDVQGFAVDQIETIILREIAFTRFWKRFWKPSVGKPSCEAIARAV